ncbi:MAG: LTA synthase family protein [Clostridiaceae bacterium]
MKYFKNKFYLCTLTSILLKEILLILLISTPGANGIAIMRAFYGVPPVFIYIAFIILLLSISFIFSGKANAAALLFINLVCSIFIIFDLWNYRAFGNFISMHLLNETANLENLSDSIISMFRFIDIIFILDIPIFIYMLIRGKIDYKLKGKRLMLFLVPNILCLLLIFGYHYIADTVLYGRYNFILFRICWTPNETMFNLSPIGYTYYDAYNYYSESKKLVLSDNDKKQITSWFNNNKEEEENNKYYSMFKGKNLLVIQVESLENFVIDKKENGQEITPTLNKIKKNSLYFSNYNEQIRNGTSSDTDLMTNTSIYPVTSGSTFFRFPANYYNSLPLILQDMGYSTYAIHPDKGAYWNWMSGLKGIGFKNLYDASYFDNKEQIGLGISDGSYFNQVVPIIEKEKKPFYTFMVTLTSHAPFDLPEKYRDMKLNPDLDKTKMGGYFQSIHYTDKQLGIFLDTLDKKGILNDTLVVIYGDHTSVHKFYNDEVNEIKEKESWWQNENKEIPLLLYYKGLNSETIDTIGGQIDLMPTLCYLMGAGKNKYENTVMGKNLLNTKYSYAFLANGSIVGNVDNNKKKFVQEGIEVADKVIRSNYFYEK